MSVYLHAKFKVSSISLLPTSKRTPKSPTQIKVKIFPKCYLNIASLREQSANIHEILRVTWDVYAQLVFPENELEIPVVFLAPNLRFNLM